MSEFSLPRTLRWGIPFLSKKPLPQGEAAKPGEGTPIMKTDAPPWGSWPVGPEGAGPPAESPASIPGENLLPISVFFTTPGWRNW